VGDLNFDVAAFEAVCRAESDPEAAAQAMQLAAKYIREQKPLPDTLREWIADALDDAALKPMKYRAKALTDALFLTANNRRPKGDWLGIGAEMYGLVGPGTSVNAAAELAASKYDIDVRTAKRYWRQYQKVRAEHDAIE
jgi:hypothetical protein